MNRDMQTLNEISKNTMIENMDMQFTIISTHRMEATMPVNSRTCQPFGALAGGASIALAETIAGLGSILNCDEQHTAVGMQVSSNHVSQALIGDTVKAVATPLHLGRTTHVWNVDIFASDGRLVNTSRVTNAVILKK